MIAVITPTESSKSGHDRRRVEGVMEIERQRDKGDTLGDKAAHRGSDRKSEDRPAEQIDRQKRHRLTCIGAVPTDSRSARRREFIDSPRRLAMSDTGDAADQALNVSAHSPALNISKRCSLGCVFGSSHIDRMKVRMPIGTLTANSHGHGATARSPPAMVGPARTISRRPATPCRCRAQAGAPDRCSGPGRC